MAMRTLKEMIETAVQQGIQRETRYDSIRFITYSEIADIQDCIQTSIDRMISCGMLHEGDYSVCRTLTINAANDCLRNNHVFEVSNFDDVEHRNLYKLNIIIWYFAEGVKTVEETMAAIDDMAITNEWRNMACYYVKMIQKYGRDYCDFLDYEEEA